MQSLSELECLELWYSARGKPLGLVVETNDAERFRQRMYAARKSAADESLDGLMLIISPSNPTGEVWIAHRKIEADNV